MKPIFVLYFIYFTNEFLIFLISKFSFFIKIIVMTAT